MALQSIAGKAYANVLSARLSQWLADSLLDEQCGFRPSRSTTDALFSLRLLCRWGLGQGQTLHICMLDLTKAFDSVDREMAWQILLSRGAPQKLVAVIRDLHTYHSAVIRSKFDSAPVGTTYRLPPMSQLPEMPEGLVCQVHVTLVHEVLHLCEHLK